jgi:mRNA interferase MazF
VRPILLVQLDKLRPALLLTRETAVPYLTNITVAPITSRVRGLASEVAVGRANGLEQESVIACDNVTTIRRELVVRQIGSLLPPQEWLLAAALSHAFDLSDGIT